MKEKVQHPIYSSENKQENSQTYIVYGTIIYSIQLTDADVGGKVVFPTGGVPTGGDDLTIEPYDLIGVVLAVLLVVDVAAAVDDVDPSCGSG